MLKIFKQMNCYYFALVENETSGMQKSSDIHRLNFPNDITSVVETRRESLLCLKTLSSNLS